MPHKGRARQRGHLDAGGHLSLKSLPPELYTRADVLLWLLHAADEDASWVLLSFYQERPHLAASLGSAMGQHALDTSTAEAVVPPDSHRLEMNTPRELWITVPNQQAACAGTYELVPGVIVNREPLWKQKGDDRWLFSGKAGKWGIGDLYEKGLNFDCNAGFVQCKAAHKGMPPHHVKVWVFWNSQAWEEDPAILVRKTPSPTAPFYFLSVPDEVACCSGVYELASHLRPNGQPCWRRRGGGRWIFSGRNGQWIVGDDEASKDGFKNSVGFLSCTIRHGGVMPDGSAGWHIWDGEAWVSKPGIQITAFNTLENALAAEMSCSDFADEPLPIVQFASAIYMEDEDKGHVTLHLLRFGNRSKASTVRFETKDKSAEAGKSYEKKSSSVEFAACSSCEKIEIKLFSNDDWSNTLAFEVSLLEPGKDDNVRLGRFLSRTRVLLMNNDYFPTNKLFVHDTKQQADDGKCRVSSDASRQGSRQGSAFSHVDTGSSVIKERTIKHWDDKNKWTPLKLFIEYVRMNYKTSIVRRGTIKMFLIDQAHNTHFLLMLFLDVYLVDFVLTHEKKQAIAELLIIALVRAVPFALLHYLDFKKLFYKVGGTSRATLQLSLFRKFVWFGRSSRISVRVGSFSGAVTRDSVEVVSDGYMTAVGLPGSFGKLILCFLYQLTSPSIFGKEFSAGVMLAGILPMLLFPLILIPFLAWRQKTLHTVMMAENQAAKSMAEWIQQTVSHCHEIQEYQMHGQAIDGMDRTVKDYNGRLTVADATICNNLYFARWLTLLCVLGWTVYGGILVVAESVSVGMFLAILKICQTTGREWLRIYRKLLSIQVIFPALALITEYLNHPAELAAARVHWEDMLQQTLDQFKKLQNINKVPLRIGGVDIAHKLRTLDASGSPSSESIGPSVRLRGNVEILQGQLVVVAGPHAQGKATLLRTIGGLLTPEKLQKVFVPSHLKVLTVSFMPQFFRGSLAQNLLFGISGFDQVLPSHSKELSEKEREEERRVLQRVMAICQRLNLRDEVLNWISNDQKCLECWSTVLSQSEAHLLSLARGLIADPDVLCVHLPRAVFTESVANNVWWALRDFVSSRGLEWQSDPNALKWHLRAPRTCIVSGLTGGVCSWISYPDQVIEVRDGSVFNIAQAVARK